MTVFGLAMGIALLAFVAALKRAHHAEAAIKGAAELRYATDLVSETVRSAPLTPVVQASGLELLVAPNDLGHATVLGTTWINMAQGVKGSKANQRMLHLSNLAGAAVSSSVFVGGNRPAGAMDAASVASYFLASGSLPTIDLNEIFAVGDVVTIPATAYGAQVTGVINSISNNAGNKTLTLASDLGVDVPNGTKILATSGRRCLFAVQASGDLRFHPDHRNLAVFTVLARDISPSPLVDPADSTSAVTVPFAITGRSVTINLQKVPRGTTAGRTVQAAVTAAFARTDPLIP